MDETPPSIRMIELFQRLEKFLPQARPRGLTVVPLVFGPGIHIHITPGHELFKLEHRYFEIPPLKGKRCNNQTGGCTTRLDAVHPFHDNGCELAVLHVV